LGNLKDKKTQIELEILHLIRFLRVFGVNVKKIY